MKNITIFCAGLMIGTMAQADNLEGVDEMLCAVGQVQICIENDSCYSAHPAELNVPNFVVINTKEKTISTTKGSGLNRATPFNSVQREDGLIYLQGMESGRAFSFVIDESGGHMTVAVSRDGVAVNVFGVCTDTDL
ncbi:MAG: hypothetical protein ACI9H8_001574 [Lysobacterales bacterium]|jgi:hypothetical protein